MNLHAWHVRSSHGIMARVVADSVNPDGDRLTTVEGIFNRWNLAELNTHRMLSRNSASSRAIPVKRILTQVWRDPAMPVSWGANQAGMQARAELSGWRRRLARRLFLAARIPALVFAWALSRVGLHKQVVNRILEPWVWHTAIVSATEWENFFKLRLHPDAQPEFQELAGCIKDAMDASVPKQLKWGEWHLPYVNNTLHFETMGDELADECMVSAACCARVSYVRQSDRKSIEEDLKLADRLTSSGHYSPLEHPARAERGRFGNFSGWRQLRSFYPGESGKQ